jgi:hypothetical protein
LCKNTERDDHQLNEQDLEDFRRQTQADNSDDRVIETS